nr:uncharacterized mitochondrial protein AtMg00810-like [Tanacetum cinerariifolium]
MQTQTSNTLHNAIMEAGSKDRPPMPAPRIDNDIYSTVDACPNACLMWKAIERLKQGESINVQDLETNLYWEFGKFTSRDGESLESYYSRFYKMMNELIRNQCTIHMGLWYPKDTGFELTAFLDSDHAGTSGGIQFLGGDKLVSWSSKKQDCTSMSSAEAEYVSLSTYCAQVLWMRTQLIDYGFHFDKIPMYYDSKAAIAI